MNEGEPIWPPLEPDYSLGRRAWDAVDSWFHEFCEQNQVLTLPIGDGLAYYCFEPPDTLRPILVYDEYEAHPAMIRGLNYEEVELMIQAFRSRSWLCTTLQN